MATVSLKLAATDAKKIQDDKEFRRLTLNRVDPVIKGEGFVIYDWSYDYVVDANQVMAGLRKLLKSNNIPFDPKFLYVE